MENVSVYAVYHLVIYGVKTLFMSLTNGIQALLGEIVAKGNIKEIRDYFYRTEWILHTTVVFVFGCTGVLIIPFIKVYTSSVNDVNYIVPLFAYLITIAQGLHCLRLPYNMMIKSFGKYKETQSNYIIVAIVNIIISVITVFFWGLIGVAIGTLVAMAYQTIWMVWYNAKHLIKSSMTPFFKQMAVDIFTVVVACTLCSFISLVGVSYVWWAMLAVEVAAVWLVVIFGINMIFYRDRVKGLLTSLKKNKSK